MNQFKGTTRLIIGLKKMKFMALKLPDMTHTSS